jgi:hypothetical protein
MAKRSAEHSRVLLVRPEGQLGNRLIQAATFQAAAWEIGFELFNPALAEYADHFPALAGDFFCRPGFAQSFSTGRWRSLFCRLGNAFFSRSAVWNSAQLPCSVLDITASHDTRNIDYPLLGDEFRTRLKSHAWLVPLGWKFRAQQALDTHRERLRQIFQPSPEVAAVARQTLDVARHRSEWVVGVHARRGDYATWLDGKYFFDWTDYARWIDQLQTVWPERRIRVLLCSNEFSAPLRSLTRHDFVEGPDSPLAALYALSGCDALLGPPSTFTLWASFYGGAPLHMLEKRSQSLHPTSFTHHPLA